MELGRRLIEAGGKIADRLSTRDRHGHRHGRQREGSMDAAHRMVREPPAARHNGHVTAWRHPLREPTVRLPGPVDRDKLELAARDLLVALGRDVHGDGLRDTPRRMADAYRRAADAGAVHRPRPSPTTRATTSSSWCATSRSTRCACTICCRSTASHTWPTCRASGSSGCPSSRASSRCFARDLQLQERLTTQVADWLAGAPAAEGRGGGRSRPSTCACRCAGCRPGARTVTSALRGLVRDDPRTRAEFLALTGGTAR